jgi:hypothetical protein
MIDKTCSTCGATKPAAAFKPRVDRPSGLRSRCRACDRLADRDRYARARAAAGPAHSRRARSEWLAEPRLADFEGLDLPDPEPKKPKIKIEAPAAEPPEREFNAFTGLDRLGMPKINRAP